MLEHRRLTLDLLALGLLATVIFLAAALWTFDPADPPSALVFPPHIEPVNVCGHWGAIASRLLFEAFGLGAYYVLLSLAVLDAVLLVRHEVGQPWLRAGGWLLSLVGVTIAGGPGRLRLSRPARSSAPAAIWGRSAGRCCRRTSPAWAPTSSPLSLIVGGLLLSTDYALVRLLAWLGDGRRPAASAAACCTSARPTPRRSSGAAPDLDVSRRRDERPVRPSACPGGPRRKLTTTRTTRGKSGRRTTKRTNDEPAAGRRRRRKTAWLAASASAGRRKSRRCWKRWKPDVGSDVRPITSCPGSTCCWQARRFASKSRKKRCGERPRSWKRPSSISASHVRVVEIQTGPVIAQFEVELEAGLRLSKITGLADDLAIALRVPSVRIVAPLPGKNTVGVEVPNNERQMVRLREVMEEADGKAQKMRIPVFLGKDVAGTPHGGRPHHPAAPADRRADGHGQERVPELDHRRRC